MTREIGWKSATRVFPEDKICVSPVVHWLALWFRNPWVADSNPAEDGQGYELFGEIALRNQRYLCQIHG